MTSITQQKYYDGKPGGYLCKCSCSLQFYGDKRDVVCPNCEVTTLCQQLAEAREGWGAEKLKRIEYGELLKQSEQERDQLKQQLLASELSRERMRQLIPHTNCSQEDCAACHALVVGYFEKLHET